MKRRYIYSRVSTDRQETLNQLHALRQKYPDALVVEETASGAKERPQLEALLKMLEAGDSLIVAALDRLGRNTVELVQRLDDLKKRDIILISDREQIDYSNPMGKAMAQIICVLAELERNVLIERTRAALTQKKANGRRLGKPYQVPQEKVDQIFALRAAKKTYAQISRETGVAVSWVWAILNKAGIENGHGRRHSVEESASPRIQPRTADAV